MKPGDLKTHTTPQQTGQMIKNIIQTSRLLPDSENCRLFEVTGYWWQLLGSFFFAKIL